MRSNITEDDEGKKVVHGDTTVGRIVEVSGDTAHVEPDPGITETIKSKLGWADPDEETFALEAQAIEEVTDDQVRVGLGGGSAP